MQVVDLHSLDDGTQLRDLGVSIFQLTVESRVPAHLHEHRCDHED